MTHREGKLGGRVAIVTGGAQGIGKGIAAAMAKEGAALVLVARTLEVLESAAESINGETGAEIRYVQGDVADRSTADRAVSVAVSELGRLDIVVNAAQSYSPVTSMEDIPDEWFRVNFETGLIGSVHLMHAAFPHFRDGGGGSIINFGSGSGLNSPAGFAAYAAAKEAIRAMSRAAARDWGKHNIRVNVINPAALSPAVESRVKADGIAKYEAAAALQYLGDPERDIGPVGVFLASDDSRYLTGQTINADGGWCMF